MHCNKQLSRCVLLASIIACGLYSFATNEDESLHCVSIDAPRQLVVSVQSIDDDRLIDQLCIKND